MKISCPDCQFTSEMEAEALPKHTAIATCPRCGCRFRFSPTAGVLGKVAPKVQSANPNATDEEAAYESTNEAKGGFDNLEASETKREDDPLPEGAIVIRTAKNRQAESEDNFDKLDRTSNFNASDINFNNPLKKNSASSSIPYTPKTLSRRRSSNPWDRAPGRIGWLASFYQTCLRVMFAAPRFFASLSPKAPFSAALIFFIIIYVLEFLLNYLWVNMLRNVVAGSSDPQLIELLSLLAPQGNILLRLIVQMAVGVLKLYILSALFLVIFQLIAPQSGNFNLIFQVVAYSTAPAVLCIVPIAGSLAGTLWSLACLAIGLRSALRVSWMQTILAFLPIVLLLAMAMRFLATLQF